MFKAFFCCSLCAFLSGCAATDFGSPDVYQRYDVQRAGSADPAIVLHVREVVIQGAPSGGGYLPTIGAAAGTLIGSRVISRGPGRYAGVAAVAAVGAAVGEQIGLISSRCIGEEIVVLTAKGRRFVVVQPAGQPFAAGESVYVVASSSGLRVTH